MLEALGSALVISSLKEGGIKIDYTLGCIASLYPIGWLLLKSPSVT
jgi:hypothetical protein